MFSGIGSPWKGVQRRLSRSISRASEILTGVGPTPVKQFKNAIIDGEEDKAIDLYTANEGDKPLYTELPPSSPFPSKKSQTSNETPLHMSARMGLMKLCVTLLGRGGDPTVLNSKMETALHSVCSQADSAETRAAIMEILLQWKGGESNEEKVSLNRVDIDGNTAVHLAALNGLVSCVEKLIALGAIISIVNKNNRTCCELADENQHKDLALALELALVFQPVDSGMAEFASAQHFPYEGVPGRLLLDGETLNESGLDAFMEEAVLVVSRGLLRSHTEQSSKQQQSQNPNGKPSAGTAFPGGDSASDDGAILTTLRARAEALLMLYSWDTTKLLREYNADAAKVLSAARLQPMNFQTFSEECKSKQLRLTGGTEVVVTTTALVSEEKVESTEAAVGSSIPAANGSSGAAEQTTEAAPAIEQLPPAPPAAPPSSAAAMVPVPPGPPLSGEGVTMPLLSSAAPPAAPAPTTAPDEDEGESCFVCGECMLPPEVLHAFLEGNVSQPGSRRLQCDSGHSFCVECWSGSVTVQVRDNGLSCMPCPGFKCGELLDVRWAPVLLKSTELQNILANRRQRLVVDCCAALKTCPIENCGLVVRIPHPSAENTEPMNASSPSGTAAGAGKQQSLPTASLCDNGHLFCWECSKPAHSPCSCQQHPAWYQLIKEEVQSVDLKGKGGDETNVEGAELANALWVAANTKKCPRCQTPIEKDEGCNHMNCRKCRKEFCWICMQDWSLHSDNTGGYFQCNRFVQNLKVKDLPEGGSAELWAEESGNAHAETLRLREKNKRMARFIHHFTRYQAHGESVQMEGRMFKETANRIRDGLLASLSGGSLKWLQGYQAPNPLLHNVCSGVSDSNSSSGASAGDTFPAVAMSGEKAPPAAQVHTTVTKSAMPATTIVHPLPDTVSYNYTHATRFLKDGFEELLKCRCILQWSYPYAYFEFENDDFGDYSRGTPHQRRSRSDRSSSFRSSFDLLQAELESIVETLSDVVARRRLRAGRDQIVLVTRGARSKRIELESIIVSYAISKQSAPERSASSRTSPAGYSSPAFSSLRPTSRARPDGYHRTRPMSNPGSSRRNRTGTGIHLRSDSEDSTDLAALLYELELASTEEASTANNLQRLTPLEPGGTTSAAAAMEAVLDRQRRLELMQLRMRLIFGTDIPLEETAARIDNNNNSDLPPPIPADASSLATGAQQRTSSGNRGTPRRIELRQARNSPGQRVNYTIDPDFEMEESDDEDAGGGRNTTAAAPLRTQIAAAGNGSLLHSDHQGASEGESSSEETGETDPQPALDAAALAIRNLLRFGSPDEINGAADSIPRTAGVAGDPRLQLQQSAESRRQRARLARMTQRAEEEANLNRAILMSLQETQTPERGRRANEEATPGTCAALADSAAGTREIDEADVAMLVSMGFTREQSVQALVENRHSVELAANRLLGIDF